MTYKSRRGAALAYVLLAGALLLILTAALLPIAAGAGESSLNSVDHKISYIDAKSAIEYAKAVLDYKTARGAVSDFYITGAAGDNGELVFGYADGSPASMDGVYAVCRVDADNKTARIDAETSRLGRQGAALSLVLGFDSGDGEYKTVSSGYIQIGNTVGNELILEPAGRSYTYGADPFASGDGYIWNTPKMYNLMPVVYKDRAVLNGVYNMMMAESVYFMGSPVITADRAYLEVMTNLLYLSGTINAENSKLKVQVPDIASSGSSVYIYFNGVTIVSTVNQKADSIYLDGIYEFISREGSGGNQIRRELDLFDISGLQANVYFKKLSGSQYSNALSLFDSAILSSTASERVNWLSGEEAGWLESGAVNGNSTPRPGKAVSMYVTDTSSFSNAASLSFAADIIRMRSYVTPQGGDDFIINSGHRVVYYNYSGPYTVYETQTIRFEAEYIFFENIDTINRMTSESKFIITPAGSGRSIIRFGQDTDVYRLNPSEQNYVKIGTIKAGTYEVTTQINLFDSNLYRSGGTKLPVYSGEPAIPSGGGDGLQTGGGIYVR